MQEHVITQERSSFSPSIVIRFFIATLFVAVCPLLTRPELLIWSGFSLFWHIVSLASVGIELFDEVRAPHLPELTLNFAPHFRLIPEKKHPLILFFLWCLGTEHRLQGIRVKPCIPCFGTNGHWCWREILDLFKLKIQISTHHSQFRHILFRASRMGTDKIRYNLLIEMLFPINLIKNLLEIFKLLERRLSHEAQNL